MKFLADENFPPSLISRLQKKRHDVKRIQRSSKGTSDLRVKEIALRERRTILTFDKDFLKTDTKILANTMFFNFPNVVPEEIISYLDLIVKSISDLKKKKKAFIASYSKAGLKVSSLEKFN